jgi:hypothetical protein
MILLNLKATVVSKLLTESQIDADEIETNYMLNFIKVSSTTSRMRKSNPKMNRTITEC